MPWKDWVSTDRLGLDVHHVISVDAPKGTPSCQLVDKDAYILIVLYKLTHGLDELYLCSRINSPSLEWTRNDGSVSKHFVLRFLEDIGLLDMGLPRENIESCMFVHEKGSFASLHSLRCFVDDRFDCLSAIHRSSPDTELVQYTNDPCWNGHLRASRYDRRSSDFDDICNKVWVMSDWRELAEWCGLPTDDALWSWLGERVPPHCDYDPRVLDHCRELFFPALPRQLSPTPKHRPSSPTPKSKAAPGNARNKRNPTQPDHPPPGYLARPSSAQNTEALHPQPKWGASPSSNPYVHEAVSDDGALPFPPTPPTILSDSQERMLHSAVSAMLTHGSDVQINISQSGSVSVSTTQPSTQLQPLATRWSTSKGSKWFECKRNRAEQHRASKQARLEAGFPAEDPPDEQPRLPMCVICQVRQRALRCNRKCCVHCCVRAFDYCNSLEHGVTRSTSQGSSSGS